MSDGDSIFGNVADSLKDLGKDVVKQLANTPESLVTSTKDQLTRRDSDEEEARKKAEKMQTFQRVRSIEAEIAQIAAQNEKKTGPQIPQEQGKDELQIQTQNQKPLDEASRQAVGRAEQGRNFKG